MDHSGTWSECLWCQQLSRSKQPKRDSSLFRSWTAARGKAFDLSASLTLIVDEPEALGAKLQTLAEQHQGYLQKTGTEVVVMRVRNESLEMVLSEIEKMGKIKQKQISGEDVTEAYQDLRVRIENGEKLRERYLDLLQKASKVEDLLLIERELERLNTELDLLKGRQSHLEKESALATIYVDIQKKVRPGPIGAIFVGIYKGLRWLFVWR
ncbi:MAG: DUF4349 domain-containing protein [Microscillaceae bacterium]|nr:DUF4349 domain-containing protein [Microscillaceae bacterium]